MLKRVLLFMAAVAGLVVAAFGAPAGAQTAQAASADPQRINFPPGTTSYVLSTTLAQGAPQSYLLAIRAGQTLYITENGRAAVQVYDPQDNSLAGPTRGPGPWGVFIPQTGDYTVTLDGAGAVTVIYSIPPIGEGAPWPAPVPDHATRISFDRGATSSTFSARLQAGVPARYLLRLSAGQQMYVTVDGNATASLLDPYGGAVKPVTGGSRRWQFHLSWTGDYKLVLQGSGAVTVTLYVPPAASPAGTATRVEFAPGNASTIFSADLVQGRPSRYVLRILAGQTLYVEVVGDENATVSVTGPAGTAVSTVRTGRPGLWVAAARTTGDYTIAISGQGQTWVTVYVPRR
jgi:hypothetical protein